MKNTASQNENKFSALFLDIGNVLIFFYPHKFYARLCRLMDLPYEVVHKMVNKETGGDYSSYEKGIRLIYDLYCRLRIQARVVGGRDFLYPAFREAFGDIFSPNDKMVGFARRQRQRGCKIVLVSNTNLIHYEYVTSLFPRIFALADIRVLSFEIGLCKPNPLMWQLALEWSEVPPEQVLVVDDLTANIESAGKLGLGGIVYVNFQDFGNQLKKTGLGERLR